MKKIILESGASLEDAVGKNTYTALVAASEGNFEVFGKLILDVACLDLNEDFTPLMIAARKNSADMAKVLIKAGADVKNDDGHTALMKAIESNSTDVAKMLNSAGAK